MGETLEKLEPFYPDRMASRILGMGDVVTLVEKAQEEINQDDAMAIFKKMMTGTQARVRVGVVGDRSIHGQVSFVLLACAHHTHAHTYQQNRNRDVRL